MQNMLKFLYVGTGDTFKGGYMLEFNYVIKDELGIHARPAGLLVKEAKGFESKITIAKGEKSTDATRLMTLMGLGVKQNDEISVMIEGADEAAAYEAMKAFFEKEL